MCLAKSRQLTVVTIAQLVAQNAPKRQIMAQIFHDFEPRVYHAIAILKLIGWVHCNAIDVILNLGPRNRGHSLPRRSYRLQYDIGVIGYDGSFSGDQFSLQGRFCLDGHVPV